MKRLADATCPVDRITPSDGAHYFYGYYDNRAFDPSGNFHLCHKATIYDRIPQAGEPCSLGIIDLAKRSFELFAQTTAWNFQQGAMLEYLSNNTDNQVIYNTECDGAYCCVVHNLATGQKNIVSKAMMCAACSSTMICQTAWSCCHRTCSRKTSTVCTRLI